jgi:hypothetical protein
MKIRILMLSLLGLIFFDSCSSDSNSSDSNSSSQNLDPNTLLPKQIMITEPLYNRFFKSNFFYNGNKIDYISYTSSYFDEQSQTIVSGSGNLNYTYNGNFITKIESDNGNISYNFTYSNGKISTCNFISGNPYDDFNIDFQYGSNGSVVRTITYPNNPNNPTPIVQSLNNLTDGIPYSITVNSKQSNIQYTGTNSVYKNIIGFNEILSNMFFCDLIGSLTSDQFTFYYTGSSFYPSFIPDWFLKLSPIYNYDVISNFNDGSLGIFNSYGFSYSYIYNEINFPTFYEVHQSGVSAGLREYGTIIYY